MKAIEFKEMNIKIAEHQEEFQTLPAYHNQLDGSLIYCFELSDTELKEVQESKRIYFKQITQGQPMQPINVATDFYKVNG